MTKIKLCGIRRKEDIEIINKTDISYIGFIFYKNSFRYIDINKAKSLKKLLNPKIKVCGVFVNEDMEKILNIVKNNIIDIIQLHGNEDNNYIEKLKEKSKKKIIKAFEINNERDIEKALNSKADFIMFDAGKGSGKTFDWNLIKGVQRNYFLAGGINLENINKAFNIIKPYAIDLSSSIESNGFKDENKIKNILERVGISYDK